MAKVAIISDILAVEGTVFGGGAERQTYHLAQLATVSGADVTVYQASNKSSTTSIDGVRVRSLPSDTKSIWSVATRQAISDGCACFHYK